ncbi:45024645-07d5-4474-b4a8-b0e6f6b5bb55 [Thermothielavioides terrestris]|uniref:45024645-07d5-4474-b4a8-b0e6f6b5bb55 n=1 Tax=Thermothielavioides terrestris TaxID=2587410 RepID=A0A3S4ARZ1_9PEZI|nr:45024645-07d5-4474-b4a8-b0e6f6b5bb55 [Thermothielavioides terrestris]
MAYLLGFSSVERFEVWERSLARDHFAIFVRDCRPRYPAFAVDIRRFEDFVDLRRSVEERVKIMWEHSSRFAMPPDKSKWRTIDHYKEFVVRVMADDTYLLREAIRREMTCDLLSTRPWTTRETIIVLLEYLSRLIQSWFVNPEFLSSDHESA